MGRDGKGREDCKKLNCFICASGQFVVIIYLLPSENMV